MNKTEGYKELEEKLKYRFKNSETIVSALTHSSYKNEKPYIRDYERLEFLGDAVLELTVSEFLYKDNPNMKEGDMTKMRASLVCEPTLAYCAQELSLGDYILLGKGEEKTGGRGRDSIISDVFEAIIGAIYLDGGFDLAGDFVRKYVLTDYRNKIEFNDSKTSLQEYVQDKGLKMEYIPAGESGPDHHKIYSVKVLVDGREYGSGSGSSKKRAEQNAAYEALKRFKEEEKERQ
ncbi:MAG: ribonuclease III [Lachnospiraceae bacterium]|nr:ribonuclease III [Lachnospiraceae bacterium]